MWWALSPHTDCHPCQYMADGGVPCRKHCSQDSWGVSIGNSSQMPWLSNRHIQSTRSSSPFLPQLTEAFRLLEKGTFWKQLHVAPGLHDWKLWNQKPPPTMDCLCSMRHPGTYTPVPQENSAFWTKPGWEKFLFEHKSLLASKQTESLWLNI